MTLTWLAPYQSFLGRFYRLSVVGVLSNMMVPLAGLVDTAFLGHLEDIRFLTGVILGSILFDYLYRILKFLRNSTNALTAEAVGQGNEQGVILAVLRSGAVALGVGMLILLLQFPIQQIGFAILSGSPIVEATGVEYFNARVWGAPAVLLNFVLIGWFLGHEHKLMVLLIALAGNCTNVGLDYLMINLWGWGSAGAGWATALSQYLALGVGLVGLGLTLPWSQFLPAVQQFGDRAAFTATLALKSNILIRFLALISAYALFTNLSALQGTTILAENGLLLQIALLSQFTVQGVGMTTQTLIAHFNGQGRTEHLLPVLTVALATSVTIALGLGLGTVLFPNLVFHLLTNHTEVSQGLHVYALWLLPLLVCTAIALMLEGYFIGLKAGNTLRNGSLLAFGTFLPMSAWAYYSHSNHVLWAALVTYMVTLAVMLGVQAYHNQVALDLSVKSHPGPIPVGTENPNLL
jgi:MATE family multidrug resistance protein